MVPVDARALAGVKGVFAFEAFKRVSCTTRHAFLMFRTSSAVVTRSAPGHEKAGIAAGLSRMR